MTNIQVMFWYNFEKFDHIFHCDLPIDVHAHSIFLSFLSSFLLLILLLLLLYFRLC